MKGMDENWKVCRRKEQLDYKSKNMEKEKKRKKRKISDTGVAVSAISSSFLILRR